MSWRFLAFGGWSLFVILATVAVTTSIRNNHYEARQARRDAVIANGAVDAYRAKESAQAKVDTIGARTDAHLSETQEPRQEHIQEVTREVVKTVYRCAVPADGRRLLIQTDAAGRAALAAQAAGQ